MATKNAEPAKQINAETLKHIPEEITAVLKITNRLHPDIIILARNDFVRFRSYFVKEECPNPNLSKEEKDKYFNNLADQLEQIAGTLVIANKLFDSGVKLPGDSRATNFPNGLYSSAIYYDLADDCRRKTRPTIGENIQRAIGLKGPAVSYPNPDSKEFKTARSSKIHMLEEIAKGIADRTVEIDKLDPTIIAYPRELYHLIEYTYTGLPPAPIDWTKVGPNFSGS